MDVVLERILSLIPKKPNGNFVHGARKEFAESIGLKSGNVIADWISGRSNSYMGYLYEISDKYDVSVEWLKGETDIKKAAPSTGDGEKLLNLLNALSNEQLLDLLDRANQIMRDRLSE